MKTKLKTTLALGLRLPSKAKAFSAATLAAFCGLQAVAVGKEFW